MRALAGIILLVSLGCVGCRAKPGDKCAGEHVCGAANGALLCVSGSYVATECKGPDGCTTGPFRCDFRGNRTGDACYEPALPAAPMACTPDKKARVRCVKGKVERDECDGPGGCAPRSTSTMSCDRILQAGAACSTETEDSCSTDREDWLQCNAGKLVVSSKCRGPAHCKPFEGSISCDVSLAQANDPCLGTASACSLDGTKVLTCQGGSMKESTACPPGRPCRPSADGSSCTPQ